MGGETGDLKEKKELCSDPCSCVSFHESLAKKASMVSELQVASLWPAMQEALWALVLWHVWLCLLI